MNSPILSLAKKLVACESVDGNRVARHHALQIALAELKDFTVERFESNGSPSVLVFAGPQRPKKFRILLNGHLDVTPGKPEQYKPRVEGDRLYGVGAMDMKASAACLVEVFKNTARKIEYPLGLQLVTDEQLGGFNGTKHQIDQGVRAGFVIAGESTGLNIAHKAKGILWAKISFAGATAHSAYPWESQNPAWDMHEFMSRLQKRLPVPADETWVTTVAISNIETDNKTFNKTPDKCTVWIDVRYVAEDASSIVEVLEQLLPQNGKIEILVKEPAMHTAADNSYITLLRQTIECVSRRKVTLYGAQGSSDARHYANVLGKGVEFGPVGGGIGTDKEWVSIKSLNDYYNVMREFLLAL